MAKFRYTAIHKDGSKVRGEVSSSDERSAFSDLQRSGLAPVTLTKQVQLGKFLRRTSIRKQDLALFIRQLAVLLSSGVSLSDAIFSVSRSTSNDRLIDSIRQIQSGLRSGERFCDCLERALPKLPGYVTQFAELGEKTGRLDQTLMQAADQYDYDQQVESEIRQALAYPVFLLAAGALIILGMFLFVVPRFAAMLSESGGNLPAISRIVIGTSLWLSGNFGLFLALLLLAVAGVVIVFRRWRFSLATIYRHLPLFSGMLKISEYSRWSRSLAGALESGSDLLPALQLAEKGVRDPQMRQELERSRIMVRGGQGIGEAFEQNLGRPPRFLIDMIKTGQQTGKLDHMLAVVAQLSRREVRERTAQITALIEPMAIVSISLIVGTIVISIVLAMTSMYEIAP